MAQNGQTAGTIFLNLSVNQNNLANQITSATNSTAASISGGLNSIFSKFLSVAALATALNTLKEFGTSALDVAANLTEVQNVVDTAFGDMAYKCEEFADKAIESFGISELSAKKTASTFMAMSTGMGLASESAANMSINVAKLSADVASFYNLSYDAASTKLKAIWTGETEGLKDLGIVMTQTNLQAYALSLGIEQNIQDMSQADQTVLRYKYVMEQLKLAQGDFAKTSDSWSNSVKTLEQKWISFQAKIGTILIDTLNPFLQCIVQIVEKMDEWADRMQIKFGIKEATEEAKKDSEEMGEALVENTEESVKKANDALLGLASMDQIQKLSGSSSVPGKSIFGDETIDDAYENAENEEEHNETLIDKFISYAKNQFEKYQGYILPIYNSIKNAGTEAWQTIQHIGSSAMQVLKDFWDKNGERIAKKATTFISNLFDGIQRIVKAIKDAWDKYLKSAFSKMIDFLGSALDLFFNIADAVDGPLIVAFENFIDIASQLFAILSGIFDIASGIVEFFSQAISGEFDINAVTDKIESGIWTMLDNSVGELFGVKSSRYQAFADGGIVSAPTIGLVGEYSNARTNPEVISPLGDLKQMMAEVVSDAIGGANGEIHLTVNLGTKTIVDEVVKGINKQTKRRNREVVVTTN